ncbi:hypothetical protein [Aliarcobacter cryaerophilus]|uniref:Uncharacterized protein n=1 Tax=Arcobacter sp. AZ-2023 TaxID=3074453 RepID=A0AA96DLI6_9BACT|nr:hypothetical protein RMQ68_01950 [Arcobacter sp. AZ-2023]
MSNKVFESLLIEKIDQFVTGMTDIRTLKLMNYPKLCGLILFF